MGTKHKKLKNGVAFYVSSTMFLRSMLYNNDFICSQLYINNGSYELETPTHIFLRMMFKNILIR